MTTKNETLERFLIEIHSKIISELDYEINFRHIQGNNPTDATAETEVVSHPMFHPNPDVYFGDRADPNNPLDPLEANRTIEKDGFEPYRPLFTTILSDVRIELDECFTINILTTGERTDFSCNEDEDNPEDFFCDHTICILNDDG